MREGLNMYKYIIALYCLTYCPPLLLTTAVDTSSCDSVCCKVVTRSRFFQVSICIMQREKYTSIIELFHHTSRSYCLQIILLYFQNVLVHMNIGHAAVPVITYVEVNMTKTIATSLIKNAILCVTVRKIMQELLMELVYQKKTVNVSYDVMITTYYSLNG